MNKVADEGVTVVENGNGPYAAFVTVGHHVMGADEPERYGGHDTGPTPYEYLLAALGACTAITVRMYANRHGWPLTPVIVKLRHQAVAAADGGSVVDRFLRNIALTGSLNDEQRRKLIEIAQRCPVSKALQRASEVVTEIS